MNCSQNNKYPAVLDIASSNAYVPDSSTSGACLDGSSKVICHRHTVTAALIAAQEADDEPWHFRHILCAHCFKAGQEGLRLLCSRVREAPVKQSDPPRKQHQLFCACKAARGTADNGQFAMKEC